MADRLTTRSRTSWVDVRDIAEAHLLALLRPVAAGERIIVSCGAFKWQDLSEMNNDPLCGDILTFL